MRESMSSVPRAVLLLAVFNLYPTVLLVRVQFLIWAGEASVCNVPAVTFLCAVAGLYLVSSAAFFLRRPFVGIAFCLLAMAASVADVLWIWTGHFVITLDIALQLFQVVLGALVLTTTYGLRLRAKGTAA